MFPLPTGFPPPGWAGLEVVETLTVRGREADEVQTQLEVAVGERLEGQGGLQGPVLGETAEVQAVLAQQVVLHQVLAVDLHLQGAGQLGQHHHEHLVPHGVELPLHGLRLVHQLAAHHELHEGVGGAVLLPGVRVENCSGQRDTEIHCDS